MKKWVFVMLMSLVSASLYAETLDQSKFIAPGSTKTTVQAPKTDPFKTTSLDPSVGSTTTYGNKMPIPAVNGICPADYYCNVAQGKQTCYPETSQTFGYADSCDGVSRFCKNYLDIKNSGGVVDDSDDRKYAIYCQ